MVCKESGRATMTEEITGGAVARSNTGHGRDCKNKMIQDFEQIRAHDRQQIQQLQVNLEELHRNSQANQRLVTQHVMN
jgi:hypothetical protein